MKWFLSLAVPTLVRATQMSVIAASPRQFTGFPRRRPTQPSNEVSSRCQYSHMSASNVRRQYGCTNYLALLSIAGLLECLTLQADWQN
jgi:hypothetical protein